MFEFAIVVLFALAISDLVVGVSNDAVNFLNSSIGSKVAPRQVIMIIASLGMMAGVTFSSGMMEVARFGSFNPQLVTMAELMTYFSPSCPPTSSFSTSTTPRAADLDHGVDRLRTARRGGRSPPSRRRFRSGPSIRKPATSEIERGWS